VDREAIRDHGFFKRFRELDMFDLQIFKVKDVYLSDGTSFKEYCHEWIILWVKIRHEPSDRLIRIYPLA
jgi:hypothetical protein